MTFNTNRRQRRSGIFILLHSSRKPHKLLLFTVTILRSDWLCIAPSRQNLYDKNWQERLKNMVWLSASHPLEKRRFSGNVSLEQIPFTVKVLVTLHYYWFDIILFILCQISFWHPIFEWSVFNFWRVTAPQNLQLLSKDNRYGNSFEGKHVIIFLCYCLLSLRRESGL